MATTTPEAKPAVRALYAGIGVNDLAVATVRDLVTTAHRTVQETVQRTVRTVADPVALREQAVSVVGTRLGALTDEVRAYPTKVQARASELVGENIAAYDGLVERGQTLVGRIRRQESTVRAAGAAGTTVSKARTARTQAAGTAEAGTRTATRSASAATRATTSATRKKAATTRSSARATATSARRTAAETGRAVADAAQKLGD